MLLLVFEGNVTKARYCSACRHSGASSKSEARPHFSPNSQSFICVSVSGLSRMTGGSMTLFNIGHSAVSRSIHGARCQMSVITGLFDRHHFLPVLPDGRLVSPSSLSNVISDLFLELSYLFMRRSAARVPHQTFFFVIVSFDTVTSHFVKAWWLPTVWSWEGILKLFASALGRGLPCV